MADETTTAQEVEAQESETDWKAKYDEMRNHMRDWEKKAKANQSAADELEKLKAAQMTEQEKANARAEKAEQELAELKAAAEKAQAAREISQSEGVPVELLEFCSDVEAMQRFAKVYNANKLPIHAAASANGSKIVRDGKVANRDKFAEAVKGLF